MRLRKIIVLGLIIPAVVYAGVRGYMWYSIKDTMTALQKQIVTVAKLEYQEIKTPILGPIGITGLTLTPHTVNDSIRIDSVLLDWNDPLDLIDLLEASFNAAIPEKLKILVNGMSLPSGGEMGRWLDDTVGFNPLFGILGCAGAVPSFTDLSNMGIESIESDTRFEYQFNRRLGNISFYTRMRNRDLMTLIFEGVIPSSEVSLSQARIAYTVPKITNFSITYEDLGYNKRRIAHCARGLGVSEPDYVELHLEGFTNALADKKLLPSAELLSAYRRFLADAGKLTVLVNPYEPIGPVEVAKFEGLDLTDALDLEVLVDQTPVKQVFALPVVEEIVETKQQIVPQTFQLTPVNQLSQFINFRIRVDTVDNRRHLAYLESVDRDSIMLMRHEVGGSVSFRIAKDDIREVSVLY